jgi:hypothetical protein
MVLKQAKLNSKIQYFWRFDKCLISKMAMFEYLFSDLGNQKLLKKQNKPQLEKMIVVFFLSLIPPS